MDQRKQFIDYLDRAQEIAQDWPTQSIKHIVAALRMLIKQVDPVERCPCGVGNWPIERCPHCCKNCHHPLPEKK